MTLLAKINETAAFLKGKGMEAPEFGLILGSGLGELDVYKRQQVDTDDSSSTSKSSKGKKWNTRSDSEVKSSKKADKNLSLIHISPS